MFKIMSSPSAHSSLWTDHNPDNAGLLSCEEKKMEKLSTSGAGREGKKKDGEFTKGVSSGDFISSNGAY